MPNYIGPALGRLSDTIYKGLSGIGESRLNEAKTALQGAELQHKISTYRDEAPLRALKLTKAVQEAKELERQNQPWNVPSWVGESLVGSGGVGTTPDAKIWAAQVVPRIATVFGDDAKYDSRKGQIVRQSTGQPITVADFEKAQDAISGMIGVHTDGDKFLEMGAKTGDPAILKQIEDRDKDPIGYLNHQLTQKTAMLNHLQSLGLGEKAMQQAWKGVDYTRGKLDKLLSEQRTEKLALEREEREAEREEKRFKRGLKVDLAKEGRTEQRAIEREGRTEGRALEREVRTMPLERQAFKQWSEDPKNAGKSAIDFKREYEKPKEDDYAKNLYVAAQSVGIDAEKVKGGKLTPEEANKLADEYSRKFGTQNFLKMLLDASAAGGGNVGGGKRLKFDSKGNPIND